MFALLSSLILAAASPAPVRLPPIDSCATDPGFAAYRTALREAIARKDRDRLLDALAEDIVVDFGGGSGRADFAAAWKLERPESSTLWKELGAALELGCAADEEAMVSPSLLAQLPDMADPFDALLARPGAALRAAPAQTAPLVAALDWHLLTQLHDAGGGWIRAALGDGRSGYVRTEEVRGPLDYRAHFRKREGRWQMTSFVAGD